MADRRVKVALSGAPPAEHTRHVWGPSDEPEWDRCTVRGCTRVRHRPLRNLGPLRCPKTADGEHQWQPLSFVFETQLLDGLGRVEIRQPDIDKARVYAVCMPCRSHTYVETAWVGYYLGRPWLEEEEARDGDA